MKKIIFIIIIVMIIILVYLLGNNLNNTNSSEINTTTNTTTTVEPTSQVIIKNNLVSYNGWLSINNNNLVNQYGEQIQLKGISSHGIQWFKNLVTKENLSILKNEWNTNVFRIAMYTNEGGYLSNNNIKEDVKEIVNNVIELDMYVIIDWHILSDGNPLSNVDSSISFFDEMSKLYANAPNVIYEICNEPNNTNWNDAIKPYAQKVISTIRNNSKKSIIIVGTNTWCQDILDPVNNPIDDNLTMYSLHFYSGTHTEWLRTRLEISLKSIPVFISEWGTSDASGNGGNYFDEANKWIELINKYNLSWTTWSLTNKNESSAILKSNCTTISDECLTDNGKYIKSILTN